MASAITIGKILAEIVLCGFPNFTPSKEMTQVWIAYLSDIDDDLLVAGLRHHIATCNSAFAPSIPEIRASVAAVQAKIAGLPTAYEAWDDLLKAKSGVILRATDANEIIREEYKFIHPLVKIVAEQLGWPKYFIGENVMADRAHYFMAWDMAVKQYLENESELQSVTKFIDHKRGGKLISASDAIKLLEVRP